MQSPRPEMPDAGADSPGLRPHHGLHCDGGPSAESHKLLDAIISILFSSNEIIFCKNKDKEKVL